MPSGAPAAQLMLGRSAAIVRRRSLSRTTMKCHGWPFLELPVQRASSRSSSTTSSGTGSSLYCRICDTRRIGRRAFTTDRAYAGVTCAIFFVAFPRRGAAARCYVTLRTMKLTIATPKKASSARPATRAASFATRALAASTSALGVVGDGDSAVALSGRAASGETAAELPAAVGGDVAVPVALAVAVGRFDAAVALGTGDATPGVDAVVGAGAVEPHRINRVAAARGFPRPSNAETLASAVVTPDGVVQSACQVTGRAPDPVAAGMTRVVASAISLVEGSLTCIETEA